MPHEEAEAQDAVPSEQTEDPSEAPESGDEPASDGSGDEAPDPGEAPPSDIADDTMQPHEPADEIYEFDMVRNPGPLSEGEKPPALNFAGGRHNEVILTEPTAFYRAGVRGDGKELGEWFTREAPPSVAHVRIDRAVRPTWTEPNGDHDGSSPIDTLYRIEFPAGTKIYVGPVGNQGGIYVGGAEQIFIPKPWDVRPKVPVVGSEPLR
ncbi:hypothetical protein ABZ543_08575 [Streptomyces roseifaciens]